MICCKKFGKRSQTSKIKHCVRSHHHHACQIGKGKIQCIQVIFQHTMGNKAKPQELKKQILCQEVDGLKAYAVNIHLEEQHRSLPHEEKC